MRTVLVLVAGLCLMATVLIMGKLFSEHVPSALNSGVALGAILWLGATGANMWLGVSRAGYTVGEELPIFLLLFSVPVVAAVIVRWRFLA